MTSYHILLADDHPIFRQGMKIIIEQIDGLSISGEAKDGKEAVELTRKLKPDMAIVDISMPEITGIQYVREICSSNLDVDVLMLTMHKNREYLYHSIAEGAKGYLLKEDSDIELYEAIDTIRNGGIYISRLFTDDMAADLSKILTGQGKRTIEILSKREKEVLKFICEGKSNKEIGHRLCISARTVENHRARIFKKLGVHNTAELIKYAFIHGFADL